jgi:hypothetical protein
MKPTKPDNAFLDYWNVVDDLMLAIYGIDTVDAGIEMATIDEAQVGGWTPRQYVLWFGENTTLKKLPGAA